MPPSVHGRAGAVRTAKHYEQELEVEEEEEARFPIEDQVEEWEKDFA